VTPAGWAARVLTWLLREGDGEALLGDLAEEHLRRSISDGARVAAQRYRREVLTSLAAAIRLRASECARSIPWGVVMAAYILVAVLEIAARLMLARVWPPASAPASVMRLVVEFPGIALIAYVASRFDRAAPYVLGTLMLVAASLLSIFGHEQTSGVYVLAILTVGPLAAVLGGMLHRHPRVNP